MPQLIDAHIHLDQYSEPARQQMLAGLERAGVGALVAMSTDLASARRTLELAREDRRILPAAGFHPEQPLPGEAEVAALLQLIDDERESITAIGEVGLPWYLQLEDPSLDSAQYEALLERFIRKAAATGLPIVLHAVYDDAETVCDLLEEHGVTRAHFHWFKGSDAVLDRMLSNGYAVSVTPEVVYRPKIRDIARRVPLSQLMVETDGPWPFEGPFAGRMTEPAMLHASIAAIAELKQLPVEKVYRELLETTKGFYEIE
ncbi:TatD-related deoxyribonuclease [Sporosarcina sp. NCCP-2716]|uniref:TatD family hydrolase n=1 Tax=Sporosarcina sp. NCCP-2716 TaxID=2943679 RepID=UPI00203DB812|nr:TatD family hydrolase [Sporosarcina sp. NCCP-2716]GKV68633.1 TatD-related deoxyribonuclease [Sporosarcina sp. NCCP-2716]